MFSDEPLPGAHSNAADTETHAPRPPLPGLRPPSQPHPPNLGSAGGLPARPWGQLHPHPSQPPAPLDPHPGQPWDPPQVTAMPLRESRASPSSRAAQTQACSRGGGGSCGAKQDWTGPGCPRHLTQPGLLLQEASCPRLALGRLCAQDPTGHDAQNNTQTRQLGWGGHKKPKTALAQPASPGLGLWDSLGPRTGGRRKPGRVGTYLARPRPNSEKDLPEHRKCWPGGLGGLGWTGPSGARERVHSSGCRA